jgi:hypothetical protein
MGAFARGQVITLPFPYSDLSAQKLRPALLLADHESIFRRNVGTVSQHIFDKIIQTAVDLLQKGVVG